MRKILFHLNQPNVKISMLEISLTYKYMYEITRLRKKLVKKPNYGNVPKWLDNKCHINWNNLMEKLTTAFHKDGIIQSYRIKTLNLI